MMEVRKSKCFSLFSKQTAIIHTKTLYKQQLNINTKYKYKKFTMTLLALSIQQSKDIINAFISKI